jgi:hypothetical protein
MATSARTLIGDALRTIGAVASGEQPTADEASDAFRRLNDLLESWALNRLLTTTTRRTTHALVVNQGTYTLGPGGHFDQIRPDHFARDPLGIVVDGAESPLTVLFETEWAMLVPWKDSPPTGSNQIPTQAYIDAALPRRNVLFDPIPTAPSLSVAIYYRAPLEAFADLSTQYDLPKGYARALRYALAMELCPEFGRPLTPDLVELAGVSLAAIQRLNLQADPVRCDPTMLGLAGYDITTDTVR